MLKGQGFWLSWIRQTQRNNRTSLHNNTCQISQSPYNYCHLIRHLGSTILDFTCFLKGKQITEINTKSSQNAFKIYNFMNFCNLMKTTVKNLPREIRKTFMKFEMMDRQNWRIKIFKLARIKLLNTHSKIPHLLYKQRQGCTELPELLCVSDKIHILKQIAVADKCLSNFRLLWAILLPYSVCQILDFYGQFFFLTKFHYNNLVSNLVNHQSHKKAIIVKL